jgi:hypothetical protein
VTIGISADSEEKHEPASDIHAAVVDSLKVLDPEWPTIAMIFMPFPRFVVPTSDPPPQRCFTDV